MERGGGEVASCDVLLINPFKEHKVVGRGKYTIFINFEALKLSQLPLSFDGHVVIPFKQSQTLNLSVKSKQ